MFIPNPCPLFGLSKWKLDGNEKLLKLLEASNPYYFCDEIFEELN